MSRAVLRGDFVKREHSPSLTGDDKDYKVSLRTVLLVRTIPSQERARAVIQRRSVFDEVSELLLKGKRGVEDRARNGHSPCGSPTVLTMAIAAACQSSGSRCDFTHATCSASLMFSSSKGNFMSELAAAQERFNKRRHHALAAFVSSMNPPVTTTIATRYSASSPHSFRRHVRAPASRASRGFRAL